MAVAGEAPAANGKTTQGRTDVPPVEERATFLVHRVNALLAQVCNPVFAAYEVDLLSSRILAVVAERNEIRMGELVAIMVLPQSTLSHQVQRLERRGLVTRTRLAEDNRSVSVALTPKGRQTAMICSKQSRTIYQALTEQFDEQELDLLVASLKKMFVALQTMPELDTEGTMKAGERVRRAAPPAGQERPEQAQPGPPPR